MIFRTAKYLAVVHETRRRSRTFQLPAAAPSLSLFHPFSLSLSLLLCLHFSLAHMAHQGDGAEIRSAALKSSITVTIAEFIAAMFSRIHRANVIRIRSANIQHLYLIPPRMILLCVSEKHVTCAVTLLLRVATPRKG